MSVQATAEERRNRHVAAIEMLLGQEDVTISGRQMLSLILHLQANVSFQRRMTTALASVAAGDAEWDAIEDLARTADVSAGSLDTFVFDLTKDQTGSE